jgi:hypothetical protein
MASFTVLDSFFRNNLSTSIWFIKHTVAYNFSIDFCVAGLTVYKESGNKMEEVEL